MNALWLAAALLAAEPDQSQYTPAGDEGPTVRASTAQQRTTTKQTRSQQAHELRTRVRAALRAQATTEGAEQRESVQELLAVYQVLIDDKTFTKDERSRWGRRMQFRLNKVADELASELAQAKTTPKDAQPQNQVAQSVTPPTNYEALLQQQLGAIGQGLGQAIGQAQPAEALIETIKSTIAPDTWDDVGGPGVIRMFPKVGALFQQIGGIGNNNNFGVNAGVAVQPNGFGGLGGGFGGGTADDNGEALVELIQAVIKPDHWDVNGGPGAIYYWRNQRALVIRATDDVHGSAGDVLQQVRRVGN